VRWWVFTSFPSWRLYKNVAPPSLRDSCPSGHRSCILHTKIRWVSIRKFGIFNFQLAFIRLLDSSRLSNGFCVYWFSCQTSWQYDFRPAKTLFLSIPPVELLGVPPPAQLCLIWTAPRFPVQQFCPIYWTGSTGYSSRWDRLKSRVRQLRKYIRCKRNVLV